jgi:hypothetical protein
MEIDVHEIFVFFSSSSFLYRKYIYIIYLYDNKIIITTTKDTIKI